MQLPKDVHRGNLFIELTFHLNTLCFWRNKANFPLGEECRLTLYGRKNGV